MEPCVFDPPYLPDDPDHPPSLPLFVPPIRDTSDHLPLPQLDPDETNPAKNLTSDIEFRHSWWAADRSRVRSALDSIFPESLRLSRFCSCGEAAWVFRSTGDPVRYKVCSDTCRDRWCRPCQRDRARIIVGNLRTRLRDKQTRLITLTIRHRSQSLRSMVDRLLEAFRTLRARRLWKQSVNGGVAFVEIKWNPETMQWHPHVHAICTGSYLSKSELKSQWYQITGDSFICDVRAVRSLDELARYVVKYATKPLDTALYRDARRLNEAILALQGRHLALTFGAFRGWRITAPGDGDEWIMVGSLQAVRRQGLLGDSESQFIVDALRRGRQADTEPDEPP